MYGQKTISYLFFTSYTSTFPLFSCHSRSHLVEAWRGRRSRNFITSPLNMIMIMIMIITIMITTITTIIITIMIITWLKQGEEGGRATSSLPR